MDISSKALRFVIEAVEHRLAWYERELAREDLPDDDRADLSNDCMYFQSLLLAMKAAEQDERQALEEPEHRAP
jgi:hypothetical protein